MNSVDEYIAALEAPHRETVEQLRALILEVPEVQEEFKWSRPVYRLRSPVCYLKVAKKHVSLGFDRGAELEDPTSLLEGTGKGMRHCKIVDASTIPADQVRAWLRQAAELARG